MYKKYPYVHTFMGKDKSLTPAGNQTPISYCLNHSLVTILIELSSLVVVKAIEYPEFFGFLHANVY